ncbi:hypothetical protein B0J14DRAFT_514215, partial [Halenospora varia]
FSSIQYLKELGQDLCDRPLARKKDLETYQRLAIKRPTTNIISYLLGIEEARHAFNLGEGIIFENYTNTLSDSNNKSLRILKKEQTLNSNPKPQSTDQICVYKEADSTQNLYIVIEYKPPYKLLLQANKGLINILEDVINRIIIPTDLEDKFVYYSKWLIVAALIQTYIYIIKNGLKYSKLVIGKANVFLLVKEDK